MDQPLSYSGVISIEAIENSGENATDVGLLTAHSVHYPDCQQLVVWLVEDGRSGYGSYCVRDKVTGSKIAAGEVAEILNGSTQILFDTLAWPIGNYVLEIEHSNNCMHQVHFRKGPEPTENGKLATFDPASSKDDDWKTYRDGRGNLIPNEDEILRQKLQVQIARALRAVVDDSSQRLQIEGNVRAGNVAYLEGAIRIDFWYEMGGGNCKIFVDIPPADEWEVRTQTPLIRRNEILTFVANEFKQQKRLSWRFVINDREIAFY